MKRDVSDKSILGKFCTEVCNIVEKHCKYIIVSGFFAIASGRSRGTEDIDMIIERLDKSTFVIMHTDLKKHGFECMQTGNSSEAYEYLAEGSSLRYAKAKIPVPDMEIKFAKDELDIYQIINREKYKLTGLPVWFGPLNSAIAFKEEYLKSDKDIADAKHLRIVYEDKIREKEINRIKSEIRRLRL